MSGRPAFEEYEPEDRTLKLIQKSKDSPFVPIGRYHIKFPFHQFIDNSPNNQSRSTKGVQVEISQ